MRRIPLRTVLAGFAVLATSLALAAPASGYASPARTASAPVPSAGHGPSDLYAPRSSADFTGMDRNKKATPLQQQPARDSQPKPQAQHRGLAADAACTISDFTTKTGAALVAAIKGATVDCVNSTFRLAGSDAFGAFKESQMVTVANAMRDNSVAYPGDNSTSTEQLVLFLRAGYYVQYYDPSTVGTYGAPLRTAIEGALDKFFGNAHSQDVTDANGMTLTEAVILIDSSAENVRYLYVVKRLLTAYNAAYDASWYMRNAANSVFTVLWRGHQMPEFISAVVADQAVIDNLNSFVVNHHDLLGTSSTFIVANAGGELTRFLDTASLQAKVRPLAKGVLANSAMTGVTATLWVRVADLADSLDAANCSYYGICNFKVALAAAALPITKVCSPAITIRAQDISPANLDASCASLAGEVAYFHNLVKDTGAVANDYNTKIEVVTFHSPADYQTYSGVLFGNSTDNGGEYLEGDPSVQGNLPRFLSYEADWLRPVFAIWNLNHEFTHYLDGRYDMYGDFDAGMVVPNIWWVEGFAEYESYGYRGEDYTAAITQAGLHTYPLSTLWETTYANTNQTRTYNWGYLAVRFMFEKHANDLYTILGYFRTGNFTAGYNVYHSTIGTRYDAEFNTWLTACNAGACAGGTTPPVNQPPTANFTTTLNNLTATFTDGSSDSDGTIASRSWNFGDGQSSTATNPTHTYAKGTYTVTLTVTDNAGATATRSQTIIVVGGVLAECTNADTRVLAQNCQRSNVTATAGNILYFYIYLPAGVTTLNIKTTGGTGNADLYYNANNWATPSAYSAKSVKAGNFENLTINNPAAGYRYISLSATTTFAGVCIQTMY